MPIQIPSDAPYYTGSGHAVAAIKDGAVVDAVYTTLADELRITAELQRKHPDAIVTTGMMSCYEFNPYIA
jgi:hypothetical protein